MRKAHFDLGSHNLEYETTAGTNLVPHTITQKQVVESDANRRAQIDQMRRANFKLPNQKSLRTETSTYKNYISDKTEGVNYATSGAE